MNNYSRNGIKDEKFSHLLLWLQHGSQVYSKLDLEYEIHMRSHPSFHFQWGGSFQIFA